MSFIQMSFDEFAAMAFPEEERNPPKILRNPKIRDLFDQCLEKTGAKPGWRTLRKHTLVDGKPLPWPKAPSDWLLWDLGHFVEKEGDDVIWKGLTVEGDAQVFNHVARIHPDGTVEGEVNGFRSGWRRCSDRYLVQHLEEWLGRLERNTKWPYWDEVDGVATKEGTEKKKRKKRGRKGKNGANANGNGNGKEEKEKKEETEQTKD